MPSPPRLALLAALALAPACLATHTAHEHLVATGGTHDNPEPKSIPHKVTFFVFLPVFIAVDVVTSPFQFWYVITHAR